MLDCGNAIASLQGYLREHPDEAEAHLRLAVLYMAFARDERRAAVSFLEYLARSLGYPDAESARRALERIVALGRADPMVHVRLGLIYGYSGMRDRAATSLRRGTVWIPAESRRFRVHTVPGSTAHRDVARFLRRRESGLRRIERLFGLRLDRSGRIVYFLYESPLHKEILTGDPMPAHVLPESREIHAVHGPGFVLDNAHEETHILLRQIGRPPKLVEEGAAEFAHRGRGVHAWFRAGLGAPDPGGLVGLADDAAFLAADPAWAYPAAASFVGFLFRRCGAERFREFVATAGSDVERASRRIYGGDLALLEAEWRGFLDGKMPRRGEV